MTAGTLRWWIAAGAFVLASFAAPRTAWCQRFKYLAPPVSQIEYERMLELLDPPDELRAAADALYEGFLAEFEPRSLEMRDIERRKNEAIEARAENRRALQADWEVAWARFIVIRHELQRAFLDDLELILTPEQRDSRWPEAARLIRRQQLLHTHCGGAHLWARVNLEEAIEKADLQVESVALLAPLLEGWAVEIDGVLAPRETMWFAEMHWPQAEREAREEELLQRDIEFGRRVRDINRRWFGRMADELGEAESGRLSLAVRQRAYGWVLDAERPARDLLAEARSLEDLDAEQRDGLAALAEAYSGESDRLDREAMRLLDDLDGPMACFVLRPLAERSALYATDENPSQPVTRRVEAARKELEDRTSGRIRALLAPEQRARLERRRPPDGGKP